MGCATTVRLRNTRGINCAMPLIYKCMCCHRHPAEDEYHWWSGEKEVVWKLCGGCCEFAIEVVECISNLDNEEEREKWLSN